MTHTFAMSCLGRGPVVSLCEDEYERATDTVEKLFAALRFEERYDLLLANYAEFEIELLRINVLRSIDDDLNWNSFHDERLLVARRLNNLLSSCRLYVDHVHGELSFLLGKKSPAYASADQEFSTAYDKYLGYRVMDGLRNFSQHEDFAIDGISHGQSIWGEMDIESPENNSFHRTFGIYLSIKRITESRALKTKVLADVAQQFASKGKVDIKLMLREYVTGLSDVHHKLRTALEQSTKDNEAYHAQMIKRYRAAGGNIPGAKIVKIDDKNTYADSTPLFEEHIARRAKLIEKHSIHREYWRITYSSHCKS